MIEINRPWKAWWIVFAMSGFIGGLLGMCLARFATPTPEAAASLLGALIGALATGAAAIFTVSISNHNDQKRAAKAERERLEATAMVLAVRSMDVFYWYINLYKGLKEVLQPAPSEHMFELPPVTAFRGLPPPMDLSDNEKVVLWRMGKEGLLETMQNLTAQFNITMEHCRGYMLERAELARQVPEEFLGDRDLELQYLNSKRPSELRAINQLLVDIINICDKQIPKTRQTVELLVAAYGEKLDFHVPIVFPENPEGLT